MAVRKPQMRLFNGHLKLNQDAIKRVFLLQLGNIFCIKSYLVENLPVFAFKASFADLKLAILEGVGDIKVQILRMEHIYSIIGEKYNPQHCTGVKALTMEAFAATKKIKVSGLETDLGMLIHLSMLESVEIVSFNSLHTLAKSLPQDDLSILLQQNLDMAKDSKELYELITKEYIN